MFGKSNKYHAKAVYIGGKRFASKLEGERYLFLRDKEREKQITDLRCQVAFRLPCGTRYIADFVYQRNGCEVVEDTKGILTDVFKLKSKCLASCPADDFRNVNINIIKKSTEWIQI